MSMKTFRNAFSCIIGIALALTMIIPVNAASQSTPEPLYDLYVNGPVISTYQHPDTGENLVTEVPYSSYTVGTKSFIFTDGNMIPHSVKIYNNHGSQKLPVGDVTVRLRRCGQLNTGIPTYLDGESVVVSGIGSEVISSYPNKFLSNEVYTFKKRDIDPDAPYSIFTVSSVCVANALNNMQQTRYEVNIYIYWDHDNLADPPKVSFKYDPSSEKMVLIGADSSMEYRARKGPKDYWRPCTDEPMYFDGTEGTERAYFVRYAAVGDGEPSQCTEIILPAKRYSPVVSYNKTTESLSDLTTQMEVQINDGPYIAATESTMNLSDVVDAVPDGSTTAVRVRFKGTSQQPSQSQEFKIYPRSQAPTGLVFDPVTFTLSGYTTAMQFRGDTSTSWKALSGTTQSLLDYAHPDRMAEVFVRYKATSNTSASWPTKILIPQLEQGPVGSIDYTNEAIVGLPDGNYQYSTNSTSWTALTITNGTWDISSRIKSTPVTLYLRWAATDTAPASAYSTFSLPARPTAPTTPKFLYNDSRYPGQAVLSGLSAGMQYRKSTDTAWANITNANANEIVFDIPAATATYYVRTGATDEAFASANKSVSLAKPGTVPNCTYNSTTEMISSLSTSMEMQIGDGAYIPVSGTTFSTTELIDSLPSGGSLSIHVRKMATETAPASAVKTFTLYSRGARPTTLIYNSAANSISGCSTTMQYRLDTATSWTAISTKTLDLQKYALADRDVKVYVRTKATTTAAASLPVEFTIPQMVVGPTGTISYLDEAIVGLANANYQYGTNGTSWTALTVTNGMWDISSLIGTSAKTLYLRTAATDTEPVSAYSTFSISARPAAPKTPRFIYNDSRYPGKAVLSDVTSGMQYRKSTDAAWINITDTNVNDIVLDIPTATTTYYVRNGTTAEAFASSNKSISLAKPGTAPSCTYNSTTEMISSLSTSMEMQIGNGAYVPVSETTFSTTTLIDSLPSGSNLIIRIRRMATETAPSSVEKTFTIYSRGLPPTTLVYDSTTNLLSGCSTMMQYRLDTATKWTAITGKTLNLQNFASADRDVKVFVRTKATATAAASLPVEFIIPQKVSNTIDATDYWDIPPEEEYVTDPENVEHDLYVDADSMPYGSGILENTEYDFEVYEDMESFLQ